MSSGFSGSRCSHIPDNRGFEEKTPGSCLLVNFRLGPNGSHGEMLKALQTLLEQ